MGTAKVKAFNLRDQNKCDRFLQVVDAHMQHQHMDERSTKLQADMFTRIFATQAQERRYEEILVDVDDAMNAGITAVYQTNVGYHRLAALTSAAALVWFWKDQLQARYNEVGISTSPLQYAQVNNLSMFVPRKTYLLQHLHKAWTALCTVQIHKNEARSTVHKTTS